MKKDAVKHHTNAKYNAKYSQYADKVNLKFVTTRVHNVILAENSLVTNENISDIIIALTSPQIQPFGNLHNFY